MPLYLIIDRTSDSCAKRHFLDFCVLVVDVNTRSFYTEKFRVMTSPVSECDTKNTDLSKLGSYRISDTVHYKLEGKSLFFVYIGVLVVHSS